MKLFRWLRSRPLARVRRNLATRRRVRFTQAHPALTPELLARGRSMRRATLYDGPIWPEVPGEVLSKERWRERDDALSRALAEYPTHLAGPAARSLRERAADYRYLDHLEYLDRKEAEGEQGDE